MRTSPVLGVAVLLCAISSTLSGQGWIDPPVRPIPPNVMGRIERLRSAVQVNVSGRVARVTVEEWFQNNGSVIDEGIYHFPLPGEAVFSSYSLWQGDQELRGEAMDATQARAIYEAIVRRKRDPALIELAGYGLIRASVFPINPGETRKITLRYTQLLDRAGDAWRFRYVGDRNRQTAPRSFRLQLDSAGRFGDPFSPTHQVQINRRDNQIDITLGDNASSGGADFELLVPLARGLIGLSLVPHHPAGEDGYFMLLLAPGAATNAAPVRRDLVAVIDVSGSMSGAKMEQARGALIQLLGSLREGDRFRLVAFSGGVRRYAQEWTAVTADSRRDATSWIRSLQAEGGTNIAGALAEAFTAPPAEQSLGVVVFLTDGQASTGETDPERIAERAEQGRGRFRVFAFGVGDDVNTYLLDRLSERARGTTEYVRPGENIERAVGSLSNKIASPVLTDLALSAGAGELYDLQPSSLPDLFAGDELVVFGRYRGARSTEQSVTVRGNRNGRQEEFTTRFADPADDQARYIEQLWASRKAGALSREIRLRGQARETLDALKQLALRYGILTEYTAYLVQEPNLAARREADSLGAMPAAAPIDQAGASSVGRAQKDRSMANAAQLQEVVVTAAEDQSRFDAVLRARSGISPTQRIGGRLFIMRDSTWTDLNHGDSLRVVTVVPYTDAYFALLKALPDLREPAALEPAVLVAGRRASIKIGTSGKTRWNPGELERLVRDFRG
ncbi:MAG TPA: VIT domain-containing protein [Gemmatimonadales bacterium]|nr:VIT domain-containing protein [Gemmatimonadales bacterium]